MRVAFLQVFLVAEGASELFDGIATYLPAVRARMNMIQLLSARWSIRIA